MVSVILQSCNPISYKMFSVCQRLSPCNKPLRTPIRVHAFSSKLGSELFFMIRSESCHVSYTFTHIPNGQPWITNSYRYNARECRSMAALNDNRENFTKQLGLKDLQTTVVLNEVRPPLRGGFEASKAGLDEVKEANIFEKGAAFIGNKVVRKAEAVKKAWVSVEEGVAPTQYAPIQGEDTFLFIFISVGMVLAFWIGNYAAPKWIFSKTVFSNSQQNNQTTDEFTFEEDEVISQEGDYRFGDSIEEREEELEDNGEVFTLPPNLRPFRRAAESGFKAGQQKARQRRKKSTK